MSYNQDFFTRYQSYLQEKRVREVHDSMFRLFRYALWYPFNIIDLGCGQCCEFAKHGRPNRWFGFDLNPPDRIDVYKCDYTKLTSKEVSRIVPFPITGFVSLFSTECCLNKFDKYMFYRELFKQHPIKAALVSGFYYKCLVQEEKVVETGDVVSYQTVEDQRHFMCDEFIEWRTCIEVPSQMFGEDVVEVWKLLTKNPYYPYYDD